MAHPGIEQYGSGLCVCVCVCVCVCMCMYVCVCVCTCKALDVSRTLVVVDHQWGATELRRLTTPGGSGTQDEVEVLCTAVLYDDLLRQVRGWVRIGHSGAAIQKELDARFGYIMDNFLDDIYLIGS